MKKILLIDDDELILSVIKKIIQERGLEVKTAKNIREAKDRLKAIPFDICFVDIRLPDGNGLSLLEDIKKLSSFPKIIIMSGETLDDEIKKILSEFLFVPKPFDLTIIHKILEEILEE